MKTTILWLAATAGIVIAAQQALAADNPNLSCITESVDDKTVRDCELAVKIVPRKEKAEPAAMAHDHDGGRKQDRERR